jgi:hypothetical protein
MTPAEAEVRALLTESSIRIGMTPEQAQAWDIAAERLAARPRQSYGPLPEIENLYTPFVGEYARRNEIAFGEMLTTANWWDKIGFGALYLAGGPVALADYTLTAFLNFPNAAYRGAQHWAVSDLTTDQDVRVLNRLASVVEFSAAITGAATPFAGVGAQTAPLTVEQRALQGFPGAAATADALATYSRAPAPAYGLDIVVDLGASKAAAFTNPRFAPVQPGIYYQAQRFGQESPGEWFLRQRPFDSLDAEMLANIRRYGNNADQLATIEVLPGLRTWQGGVASGAGEQIFIQRYLHSQYIRTVETEPLFISELKFMNRK